MTDVGESPKGNLKGYQVTRINKNGVGEENGLFNAIIEHPLCSIYGLAKLEIGKEAQIKADKHK